VVAAVAALVSGQEHKPRKNDFKIVCGCSCCCFSEWSGR